MGTYVQSPIFIGRSRARVDGAHRRLTLSRRQLGFEIPNGVDTDALTVRKVDGRTLWAY